ncbi:MAG: metallopeptidase TldD-related protein [Bacillota bacterium]
MVGRERVLELLERALSASPGDQTEVVFIGHNQNLTRFAENQIHQNVAEKNARLSVRVVVGKKVGVAGTNSLDEEAVRSAVARATEIARWQRDNPRFVSLPAPVPIAGQSEAFYQSTADCSPEERAGMVGMLINRCRREGLRGAGALATGTAELAVANSLGVRAYTAGTTASFSTVVMSEDSSGYADFSSSDIGRFDPEAATERAVAKCLNSRSPVAVEPGEYTVILEEPAVADVLFFLGYLGFGAQALQEGRSFLSGQMGQRVFGENISIWDDGNDPAGMPIPFDFEGIPKQRVILVEQGVAKGVVYDSLTANQESGRSSTGHALPAPNIFGPIPINLFMAPGNSSLEEMVAGSERGILVTRFHYTNPVHPVKAILTGMTRDGTFLIEDGRITKGLKNLRFTESMLKALNNVEALTAQRKFQGGYFGGSLVPAIKVSKFTFTGATQF